MPDTLAVVFSLSASFKYPTHASKTLSVPDNHIKHFYSMKSNLWKRDAGSKIHIVLKCMFSLLLVYGTQIWTLNKKNVLCLGNNLFALGMLQ